MRYAAGMSQNHVPAALGIDLGGTKTEAVLFHGRPAVVWRQRVATPGGNYTARCR
jgi:fructokinase